MSRVWFGALVSVSAIALAAPAFAQEGVVDPAAPDDESAAQTSDGLNTIMVTAQRREENLQDVAVAVTAISGDDLVGATTAEDIGSLAPALVVQPVGGSGVNFYLRGVGTQSGNSFGQNAVALNFNGVYIARPTGPIGIFYDLERVEVVKGPQGILYGTNATGGAVNVLPREPKLGEVEGYVALEYGNYDKILGSGAINVPIGDSVALRVAGQITDRDGYLSDGYQDESGQAARATLLIEPSSTWSLTLTADWFHQGGKGYGSVLVSDPSLGIVAPPLEDLIGGADPLSFAALNAYSATVFAPPFCGGFGNWINSGCLQTPQDDGFLDNTIYGLAAEFEADLGFASLIVEPAYRRTKNDFRFYVPGFMGDIDEDAEQISVEARLQSSGNNVLDYVVGAFYFEEDLEATNLFYLGGLSQGRRQPTLQTDSWAVFGQLTYHVADTLRLVGGLRYTDDSRTALYVTANGGRPGPTFPRLGPYPAYGPPVAGALDYKKVTWKAGVEWDVGFDSLVYANVATGFKSGGFFAAPGVDNSFEPEELMAYTIGSKNRFLDDRLQLNIEAFYWDYTDQQIGFVGGVVDPNGGLAVSSGIVVNAGEAEIYGVEAELLFAPTDNDVFSLNAQYLHAEYKTLVFDAFSNNPVQPPTGCNVTDVRAANPGINGATFFTFDCSGFQALNSPDWSLNGAYEHTFELGGGYDLIGGARAQFETSRFLAISYRETDQQESWATVDAFVTLEAPNDDWSITGYINNITDERIFANTSNFPVLNATYAILRPPRTYGVRLKYNF